MEAYAGGYGIKKRNGMQISLQDKLADLYALDELISFSAEVLGFPRFYNENVKISIAVNKAMFVITIRTGHDFGERDLFHK